MSFNDELKKLQRTLRSYIRYQTGTGSENPGVSGDFTDRRYGVVADNSGTIPIRPQVSKFGTFSRALTNLDQGFETPNISTTMTDATGEWRMLAARPWRILNRFLCYAMRVKTDTGEYLDKDVVWGQVSKIDFATPDKVNLRVEVLPGDYFGKSVPRRTITKADWPNADPSVLGKPVPIIYGMCDSSSAQVQNFTGTVHMPPPVTGFVGDDVGGDPAYVYSVSAILATYNGLTNVQTAYAGARKGALTWSAYPGAIGYKIARAYNDSFLQMETQYIWDGGLTSFEDDGTGWWVEWRLSREYLISSKLVGSDVESPMTGPVHWTWCPNTGPYSATLSWTPLMGASHYIIRRREEAYHFGWWWSREWTLDGHVSTFTDPYTDHGGVLLPQDSDKRVVRGAVEALYVDTNPTGSTSSSGRGTFPGPTNGGPTQGSSNADFTVYTYNGRDYPIVNLRVTFPDCTSYMVGPGDVLISPGLAANCTPEPGYARNSEDWGWKYLVAGHGCKEIREVFVEKSLVSATGGPAGAIDRPTGLTVTAGGGLLVYRYCVTAVNGNGESTASFVIGSREVDTSVSLTWNAVAGATGYRVYRAYGDATDFDFRAEVGGNAFTDDLGPCDENVHPGERNTTSDAYKSAQETTPPKPVLMHRGVDYDVLVEDRNGSRYQVIRFHRSQEGSPVTVNVWGIEDEGTATGIGDGGTLITSGILQFRHFLLNWVFNSATGRPDVIGYVPGGICEGGDMEGGGVSAPPISGDPTIWYTDTGYQPGMLDVVSFEIANAAAQARIPGGYTGAGALSEQTDVRAAIWDWLVSFDLDWYFWGGTFKVSLFTPTLVTNRADLSQYTMVDGIFRESFNSTLDVVHHTNRITFALGPQVDGFVASGKVEDADAIQHYGRAVESDQVVLRWTRDYATALDVMTRRLRLVKDPPIRATFLTSVKALTDELSTLIAVTHTKGIAPVSSGWSRRVCKIERSDIDFDKGTVQLQVRDVDFLLAVAGYVYYGDRLWNVSERSYSTATGDKQDTYAYLANRDTGRFSNGQTAKKLQSRS